MKEEPLRIFIVAGEASGDLHAAPLMAALRSLSPREVLFRGIGGDAMQREGLETLVHCDSISVIGFWEVLKRIGFFVRLLRRMTAEIEKWKPDILLTVDYPGFNLRLAANAKKLGVPTVHYICPQVWVWRRSRIWKIARVLDGLVAIFPFEPDCFLPTRLRPVFAGHPLVDRASETFSAPEAELPWLGTGRRVALLPGSREGEISRILPDMLAAAADLEAKLEEPVSFIIPASSAFIKEKILSIANRQTRKPSHLGIVDSMAREVLRQAEAAAVASGTATLEAALMLCPTVLAYRVSPLTYLVGRIVLRKAGFIGLANLMMKRQVMPELVQKDLSPGSLSGWLMRYLTDAELRGRTIDDLRAVGDSLGDGNSAIRAAKAVLSVYGSKKQRETPYGKEKILSCD